MNTVVSLDPLVSEFETEEQEKKYDAFFRSKVQRSIQDTTPNVSHDQAMLLVHQELRRRKEERATH